MNKPGYIGLAILELNKILIYEFWYQFCKTKICCKSKIVLYRYRQFHCFVSLYKDIAVDVKTRFDTSIHELDRWLFKRKKKKVSGIIKNQLWGRIITKFVDLKAKIYIYLIDDSSEDKKAKHTKNVSLKVNLNLKVIKAV